MANRNEKKMEKKRSGLWKLPQPVEIGSGGPSAFSIDDFHRCLEKPTQQTLRLFHSYHQARHD